MSWPPLSLGIVAAVLYAVGSRRRLRLVGSAPPEWRRRSACYLSGVALVVLVTEPPFDGWADELLAAHMFQHIVLMAAAPALLVLGAPWIPVWRGVPLAVRRPLARGVVALPSPLRAGFRAFLLPAPAFVLVNLDLALWHVPGLYDLTLRSEPVHYLEHALFLLLGLLFWVQVLDSHPLHPKLEGLWRVGYATASSAAGWILALVLALDPSPLYASYAALQHRPGGLSALADQELAAGVMIGLGSIPYAIAVFVGIYQWLDDGRPRKSRRRAPAAAQ